MKKIVIIALLLVLSSLGGYAQRFAYVDSDYILKHIPEYNSSQKQLDALSAQWQKEVDIKFASIEGMFKAYQADQDLLMKCVKVVKTK